MTDREGRSSFLGDMNLIQNLAASLGKKIQHYKYKIRYEIQNLFIIRKEIAIDQS